jgi:serpin B
MVGVAELPANSSVEDESMLASDQHETDIAQIVQCSNDFAVALYSKLAQDVSGNFFVSPVSVMTVLAMAFAGASGETAKEMADALHFSLPDDWVHEGFRKLRESTRTGDIELRVANRLWGQKGYRFLPEFLETTERFYGARLAEVDFRGASEDARAEINRWVEEQTAQKIKELIPLRDLDSMTRLVLTSAVYFLGCWEHPFREVATSDAPFWSSPQNQSTVRMMEQRARLSYGEFDGIQSLEMPYRGSQTQLRRTEDGRIEVVEDTMVGSDLGMCILLPRQLDGMADVEARFSSSALREWTSLSRCPTHVHVPKFRVDSTFRLKDTLASMGMRKAFSMKEADFSRMSDDPEGLFIAEAIHKTYVDVNERGTEAAAATATVMRGGCVPRPEEPKVFRADHPFIFLIRDRKTELIHFIGRLTDPS